MKKNKEEEKRKEEVAEVDFTLYTVRKIYAFGR
jgi:hypothetical protein